ncbi:hypothetical protein RD792_016422 [Penstemon davidsonii]|uniref:Dirigent protein n=1 Tax=Penstemon davidsonii TaxID=160366 RepID=A0ABR0CKX9_9LAMI|nr:hypothetical protein RD792_016422 [Penstemon davidsonii]
MAGKNYLFILILVSAVAILTHGCHGINTETNSIQNWLKNLHLAREKITELQFYVQDILSGPNPSNIQVARANSTLTSPTSFGSVAVLDDPVRTGPSSDSEIIGRAQGLFALASLEEMSLHMTFDLVFTSGDYNGSSISIVGHNPYLNQNRELSVVGGTGAFRFARGVVAVNTVSLNSSTGDAFFQYNVTVLHYI